MDAYQIWLCIAGVLAIIEITTGTFYLLFAAGSALIVAGVTYLDPSIPQNAQVGLAAMIGGASSAIGFALRPTPPAQTSKFDLDIGQEVMVDNWDENNKTVVTYRGCRWEATSSSPTPAPGPHKIQSINGLTLVLDRL